MSKLYAFVMFVVFSSSMVNAGEAEQQAANELLNIIQFEKVMNETVNSSIEMMKQMNPETALHEATLRTFFNKCMNIEALKSETVAIYADTFVVSELNDMIAFYKTPTGQKALQKLPEIMQRSMQSAQTRVMENIGELEALLTKGTPAPASQPASA